MTFKEVIPYDTTDVVVLLELKIEEDLNSQLIYQCLQVSWLL